jgi:hypothetical protein
MSATILRTLDLKRHLEWDADGIVVRIVLAEDETKNHRRLGFALSEDLSTRVKRHARVSRAHLRSSPNSTALFPGHGKMRLLRGHVLRPATDHAADPTRGMIYGCGKRADHSVTAARARNGQEGAVVLAIEVRAGGHTWPPAPTDEMMRPCMRIERGGLRCFFGHRK